MCDGEFPLSFAQQRLWFIDQLEPGGSLYNLPAALRLKGKLDVSALEHALDEVVRRHESLRTTFPSRGGCPVHLISPTSGLRLRVRDLTALPADERENEAQRLAAEESKAPFDLVSGPLVRALLVKLSEEEHVALCTMHHIISDWWSVGVFIRELTVFYQAHIEGRELPLPELLIHYADYAAWEQQHLSGEALEEKLSYWKEALAGAPALLKLPTDRARPDIPSYRGARQVFSVPEEVCRMLCELSRREGATLFMTLLAAFGALLSRYSGQEDVLVGTEVANRTRHEVEGVIGPFVNRLPLRVRMPAGGTFSDLLRAVRGVTLDAYAHHDVPFGQVVAALQPESVSGRAPLFQVVFVLQSPPTESIDLPDLRLDSLEMGGGTVEFDLKLTVVEAGRGLTGTFEYSTDIFDAQTIERMSGDFNALLAEVAEESSRRVGELRPLSGQEQRGMPPEGNEQMLAAPTCNETGDIKHHWQEVHEECQTCEGSGYVDLFKSDRCVVCKGKTSTVRYECRICHHRLESIDVERLLTGLGSDNADEQEAARGELIESGDLVVDLLLTSLSEGPVTSRVRAAKALGAIGNVRAVEPLLTASRYDSSRWVRETARRSLGMIRGDEGMGARGRLGHSRHFSE